MKLIIVLMLAVLTVEGFALEFNVDIGAYQGETTQSVFDTTGAGASDKLSELNWQDTVPLVGAGVSVGMINLDIYANPTEGTGDVDSSTWLDSTSTMPTDTFEGETTSDVMIIDLNAEIFSLPFGSGKIAFLVGYKSENIESENSEGTYSSSGDGDWDDGSYSSSSSSSGGYDETWINYSREFVTPYFGILMGNEGEKSSWSARLLYSNLVEATAEDTHTVSISGDTNYYEDSYKDGEMFAVTLKAKRALSKRLSLTGKVEYTFYDLIEGTTKKVNLDTNTTTYHNGAGIEYESLMLNIGVELEI